MRPSLLWLELWLFVARCGQFRPILATMHGARETAQLIDLLDVKWWRREDSNLRHGAYETPALPPELRRRVGDRAENVQAYKARVKRAWVASAVTVPEIVPVSGRATS